MYLLDPLETCTLKKIRAAYIGRRLDAAAIADSAEASRHRGTQEVTLSWESLDRSSGESTRYDATVYVDGDCRITGVDSLHCERLIGDDARASGYRTSRAGDSDYFDLDLHLYTLLAEEDKEEDE